MRRPKPPKGKPIRPNVGIERAYQRELDGLIRDMQDSVVYWITLRYGQKPPELASDASPAAELRKTLKNLGTQWLNRFDQAAPKLAEHFSKDVLERSDRALAGILNKAGFSVRFKLTAPMNDVLQATISQNVSLIKSIAAEHLQEVEGLVMRSVQVGRDIGGLRKDLQERYGITRRRAATIARSQNNLSTATMQRARQLDVGITEARWKHSGGGKHPRPDHVRFAEGRDGGPFYSVQKGAHISGQDIFPGQLINCFPGDTLVGLETRPTILWRTPFDGPMIHVQIGPDLLKGTANHPVLTARGWIPLGKLNRGDQVVCMVKQGRNVVGDQENNRVSTFSDLFEANSRARGYVSRSGVGFNFYGEAPNGHVDEVIVIDDHLHIDLKAGVSQDGRSLAFTDADTMRPLDHIGHFLAPAFSGGGHEGFPPITPGALKPHGHGGASPSGDSGLSNDVPNDGRGVARLAEMSGYGGASHAGGVEAQNLGRYADPASPAIDLDADRSELFAEFVRVAADRAGRVFEFGPRLYEFRSVGDKRVVDYSGHVFTMQTMTGYYSVAGARVQAKNCRCVCIPVIPGLPRPT